MSLYEDLTEILTPYADKINQNTASLDDLRDDLDNLDVETDKTLSVDGKPADAKTVGDELTDLNKQTDSLNIAMFYGYVDVTPSYDWGTFSGDIGETISISTSDRTKYCVLDVSAGEQYHLNTRIYGQAATFYVAILCDADGIVIDKFGRVAPSTGNYETDITIPAGVALMYVKGYAYKTSVTIIKVERRITKIEKISDDIQTIDSKIVEAISAITSTKTGIYCKTGYIGSNGYATDAKRCQTTNFMPEKTLTVSCPDSYLVYLAAYNKSTGKFVGYYTTDNTLAASPINKQRFFDLASIKKTFSGYDWRVTIQTSDNQDITSDIYPITIVYIEETQNNKYECQIDNLCALIQGGFNKNGGNYTSDNYVRTSFLAGCDEILMSSGYLVSAIVMHFNDNHDEEALIYREGLTIPSTSPINYGYTKLDLRSIQKKVPEGIIRLVFHKVDNSPITPNDVIENCRVFINTTDFNIESVIDRYSGRCRNVTDNYATGNLVKGYVASTIGADEIQGESLSTPDNGVSKYGRLFVDPNTLKLTSTVTSEAVQLKGVCVWNIADGSQAATIYGLRSMRRRGANVIRVICMPTTNAGRGILEMSNKTAYMGVLKQLIYDAITLDMYVVLDWHLLHNGNPLTYTEEASEFFDELSDEFIDSPNILYEICNEPHGGDCWNNIKSYANTVIPVIRSNCPNAVCIVGTPNYSIDLSFPAEDPILLDNILYTYHFYKTYDPDTELSPYVSTLPIFVTEWGAKSAASGSGASYDIDKSQAFLTVLAENKISWLAWSLWQGDNNNGSTFFESDYQEKKLRVYGGWQYKLFNSFGRLVVRNLAD